MEPFHIRWSVPALPTRTYAIDTNRVFICGHSMGGYGTWSIGPRHADLFAAGAAMAGGVFTGGKDAEGK
ncbi:MAG: prolyl oligopeptidase family serine peptidase, partial [Kofleriaceae bacterium]